MGFDGGSSPAVAAWLGAGGSPMPPGWRLGFVDELLAKDRGLSVGVMYPGDHDPNGVPLIKVGDVAGGHISPDPPFRISAKVHHEYRRTALDGSEVLLTLVGNPGKCFLVRPEMRGWNAARALAVLRLESNVDRYFFRIALCSPPVQHLIAAYCNTTVQATLNLKEVRSLPIPLPPLPEQRRIAAVLGALDDKIELNRKMNQTLEQMAQAIFKSWFIDFDGHDPADMVESELGLIPRGWRIAHLGNLCSKIGSGATPRGGSDAYVEAGTSFIRSQNVYDFDFDWGGLVRLTDEDAQRLQGVTVEKDDVLLNITGDSILRTCVVDPAVLPARVNQHVAIIRPKPPLASSILHLHLVQPRMKAWLLGHSAGATRKAVTKGHLEGIPVLLPPDEELHQVGASLAPMYAKRAANWAESRTLTTLRDTLLPKLISGEIRVPDAEATIAAAT